jgi:hypothetical protein
MEAEVARHPEAAMGSSWEVRCYGKRTERLILVVAKLEHGR